jgi:hypothetical protein
MGAGAQFDRQSIITRNSDTSDNDSTGSNFSFDDGSGDDSGIEPIINEYPCKINENVNYDTSKKGEEFEGSAIMKGMLTDKLQKGDIIDGEYKIVSRPRTVHGRYVKCNLVRL